MGFETAELNKPGQNGPQLTKARISNMLVLGIETATPRWEFSNRGHEGVIASFHTARDRRHAETLAPASIPMRSNPTRAQRHGSCRGRHRTRALHGPARWVSYHKTVRMHAKSP